MNSIEKYIKLEKRFELLKNEMDFRKDVNNFADKFFYMFVLFGFIFFAIIYSLTQYYSMSFLSTNLYKVVAENFSEFISDCFFFTSQIIIAFTQSYIFIMFMKKILQKKYNSRIIDYYFYKNFVYSLSLFAIFIPFVFLAVILESKCLKNNKTTNTKSDIIENKKTDEDIEKEINFIEKEMDAVINKISSNKKDLFYLKNNLNKNDDYKSLYKKVNKILQSSFLSNKKDFIHYELEKINSSTIKNI